MKNIRIHEADLPDKIQGVCVEENPGFLILINQGLSDDGKNESLFHEFKHLVMRHFERNISVSDAEFEIEQGLKYSTELRG